MNLISIIFFVGWYFTAISLGAQEDPPAKRIRVSEELDTQGFHTLALIRLGKQRNSTSAFSTPQKELDRATRFLKIVSCFPPEVSIHLFKRTWPNLKDLIEVKKVFNHKDIRQGYPGVVPSMNRAIIDMSLSNAGNFFSNCDKDCLRSMLSPAEEESVHDVIDLALEKGPWYLRMRRLLEDICDKDFNGFMNDLPHIAKVCSFYESYLKERTHVKVYNPRESASFHKSAHQHFPYFPLLTMLHNIHHLYFHESSKHLGCNPYKDIHEGQGLFAVEDYVEDCVVYSSCDPSIVENKCPIVTLKLGDTETFWGKFLPKIVQDAVIKEMINYQIINQPGNGKPPVFRVAFSDHSLFQLLRIDDELKDLYFKNKEKLVDRIRKEIDYQVEIKTMCQEMFKYPHCHSKNYFRNKYFFSPDCDCFNENNLSDAEGYWSDFYAGDTDSPNF